MLASNEQPREDAYPTNGLDERTLAHALGSDNCNLGEVQEILDTEYRDVSAWWTG